MLSGMNGFVGEALLLTAGEEDGAVLVVSMTLELRRKGLNLDSRRDDEGLLAGEAGDEDLGDVLFGSGREGSEACCSEGSIKIGDVDVGIAGGRRVEPPGSGTGSSETCWVSQMRTNTTNEAQQVGPALGIYMGWDSLWWDSTQEGRRRGVLGLFLSPKRHNRSEGRRNYRRESATNSKGVPGYTSGGRFEGQEMYRVTKGCEWSAGAASCVDDKNDRE